MILAIFLAPRNYRISIESTSSLKFYYQISQLLNPIYRSQKKEKEIVNSSTIVSLIDNADFRFNNYYTSKWNMKMVKHVIGRNAQESSKGNLETCRMHYCRISSRYSKFNSSEITFPLAIVYNLLLAYLLRHSWMEFKGIWGRGKPSIRSFAILTVRESMRRISGKKELFISG